MKTIRIIKSRPLKEEEVVDQLPQDTAPERPEITYESNPLEFMLQKYPTLTETLVKLLTEDFRNYITGVYIMAPKPTIFKIVLHNNRSFYLTYMGKCYEAKVSGKKFWLLKVSELETATIEIANLLMLGTPPTTQGPETEIAAAPEETPAETPEETPAEEEGSPDEITESKKKFLLNLLENIVTELTISPDYQTKKGPNPYYTITPEAESNVKKALKGKADTSNLLFKNVEKPGTLIYQEKGNNYFQIMNLIDGKAKATKYYIALSKSSVTGHYGESSKGSGGGAEQTAVQESAQCLVNAIRYNKGKDITPKDLTATNIKSASKRTDTSSSLEEMVTFLKDNPDWQVTASSTANALAKQYPSNFTFYRQSGIVLRIEAAAKIALKNAGVDANINKWNPADMWMATDEVKDIEFPTDLQKLNALIAKLFNAKKLIGVSLKKCSACKVEVYNNPKVAKSTTKFDKIEPIDKNIFATKDIYLSFEGGKVQFRNFNDITSWQGEIKGKEASGGKIGQGIVSSILKSLGQPGLSNQREILTSCQKPDAGFISNFYKLYNNTKSLSKVSAEEFTNNFKKAPLGNRTSNYFNVEFLNQFGKLSSNDKDKFISELVGYAKSSSSFSSIFAKVS
jgi:hypothetical protein